MLVEELPVMPVHSKPNPLMEVGYRVSPFNTISVILRYTAGHWDDPMAYSLHQGHASSHHLMIVEQADLTFLVSKTCVLYMTTDCVASCAAVHETK